MVKINKKGTYIVLDQDGIFLNNFRLKATCYAKYNSRVKYVQILTAEEYKELKKRGKK